MKRMIFLPAQELANGVFPHFRALSWAHASQIFISYRIRHRYRTYHAIRELHVCILNVAIFCREILLSVKKLFLSVIPQ
jgi:hypothetical protein